MNGRFELLEEDDHSAPLRKPHSNAMSLARSSGVASGCCQRCRASCSYPVDAPGFPSHSDNPEGCAALLQATYDRSLTSIPMTLTYGALPLPFLTNASMRSSPASPPAFRLVAGIPQGRGSWRDDR